jgi:serine/threonine-protein kinase HipA
MTPSVLVVLLGGTLSGRVTRDRRGRFRFEYEPSYRNSPLAIPLSLSMPLALSAHAHDRIHAFMWGILPDNERVLDRWAKHFHVSSQNPFALLAHVGEDCAGAVQFALPERLDSLAGDGAGEVAWLKEHEVAERLRELREDPSSWRAARDTGQFSLAGAQPKTALVFVRGRWGVPAGRTPTTHIFKPPVAGLDGHAENEHLCLALARELGLAAATSEVRSFGGEKTIVVERYDRIQLGKSRAILRLHQEDFCQALGLMPTLKYQNEGGPTPKAIVDVLRTHSSRPDEDVKTFVDTLTFNWLIAGTDAHAKNYSLLLGEGGQVRLAPLYDLGSALPYDDLDQRRLKLAMKLGDTYRVRDVAARHFRQLANALGLHEQRVLRRASELAQQTQQAILTVAERAKDSGLTHPIIDRLVERIGAHAARCLTVLRQGS